jgi:hypothetical protein
MRAESSLESALKPFNRAPAASAGPASAMQAVHRMSQRINAYSFARRASSDCTQINSSWRSWLDIGLFFGMRFF